MQFERCTQLDIRYPRNKVWPRSSQVRLVWAIINEQVAAEQPSDLQEPTRTAKRFTGSRRMARRAGR